MRTLSMNENLQFSLFFGESYCSITKGLE